MNDDCLEIVYLVVTCLLTNQKRICDVMTGMRGSSVAESVMSVSVTVSVSVSASVSVAVWHVYVSKKEKLIMVLSVTTQ
jgi:hypothetical protein